MSSESSDVQSVRFDRTRWNITQARKWLREHKFKHTVKVDKTPKQLRFRQIPPQKFVRFRVKRVGKGISLLIGFYDTRPKKKRKKKR